MATGDRRGQPGTSRSVVRRGSRSSSCGLLDGGREQGCRFVAERAERVFAYRRCRPDEQPSVIESDLGGDRRDDRPELAAQPIASRRRSDGTADREGDAQRHCRGIVEKGAPQGLGSGRAAGSRQCLERPAAADPPDQADSRVRPLSRRALMIDRPARVRIRARKPCLRARRRVLGWNVRFTGSRPSRACSTNGQAPRPAEPATGRSGCAARRRSLNAPRLGPRGFVRQPLVVAMCYSW